MSFLRCYHTIFYCPKGPSDAWSTWCNVPIKCLFASDFSSDNFNPLHTFCVTGTTPCLPTDFWVKLLWQGKALPRSSWWTTLFTDPLSYLQQEDLAAHLFTVLAAKAPEAVKSPHASENRTINLIYMIRGITFLSKWVAPKLVTFGK